MIPTIGSMIGLYIVVRMMALVLKRGADQEHIATQVAACVTIAVTLWGIYSLAAGSADVARSLQTIPFPH